MAEEKVYITVKGYGEARFEEKRSVFIGYCEHVTCEEEALAFVKRIKEKHKDATHNCYGYVMKGGILCRYSGKLHFFVLRKMFRHLNFLYRRIFQSD